MSFPARALAVLVMLLMAAGPFGAVAAQAQTGTGSIAGVARDVNGQPLAGVTITATGPTTATATSDEQGAYTLTGLPPGLYQVTATKSGYNPAEETDFAVLENVAAPLDVNLAAVTLTSLREIGHVTSRSGRGGFNSSSASVATISDQTFTDEGALQVQRILDQTPGIVVDHPGTSANNAAPSAITFPSIRGGLGFETASLIDGHPVAVQTFGDYVTTFLNTYMLQSVEVIKGPGASSANDNYAINGTVNFRTREPTSKPFGEVDIGADAFGGVFSNFLYSGYTPNRKLGWVLQYAVDGTPGPLGSASGYEDLSTTGTTLNGVAFKTTTSANVNPLVQNNPNYGNSTLVACCVNLSQTLDDKSELVKLRYNFSGATQATVSYLGNQVWADQNGNHVYGFGQNFTPGAGYAGPLAAGDLFTFQNVPHLEGYWEINNEPIFQAEVRTTLHNDIVLARWYAASINRLQYTPQSNPLLPSTLTLNLFGTATSSTGTPLVFNGTPTSVTLSPTGPACQNAQNYWVTCAAGQTPTGYTNTTATDFYRSMEEDKLHGGTFEYDHFLGNSSDVISFDYDQVNSNAHSYSYDGDPYAGDISIPAGSKERFQTLLLRGIFNLGQFNLTLANYLNLYSQTYSNNISVTAAQVAAIPGLIAGTVNPLMSFVTTNYTHDDPRIALTFRPSTVSELRFAAGSAIAPPYLSLLNATTTTPAVSSDGTYYSNTVNAGSIRPETAFGYDLGGDFRIGDRQTVVSADLYRNNVFNQFLTETYANGTYNGLPLYSSSNANLGNARYEGLELAVNRDPTLGFGFVAQGALVRAYPYDISPCFYSTTVTNGTLNCTVYNTNLAIVPGVNYYNSGTSGTPGSFNAVSNHSEPYAQGYGEVHYRFARSGYASFGLQYYGNNNSLNVPAFWLANATVRIPLGMNQTWIQASADNLLSAEASPFVNAFGGVPVPLLNGKLGLTNANVIGPRNVRVFLTKALGD